MAPMSGWNLFSEQWFGLHNRRNGQLKKTVTWCGGLTSAWRKALVDGGALSGKPGVKLAHMLRHILMLAEARVVTFLVR